MSDRNFLPRAKDFITEEDIKTWVTAALQASLPKLMEESRDVITFAMQEHNKVLAEQTRLMRGTIERQSADMIKTLEVQGRTVARLIAFGGLSGICSFVWRDLLGNNLKAKYAIACGYGFGVLGIVLCM